MNPCTKHGYTNPTFCPACDQETIERYAMKDLIERLEKATGPCFGLEQEIMWAVYHVAPKYRSPNDKPKNYTYSVDAALTLVPDGDPWTLGQNIHHRYWLASVNEFKPDQSIGSRGEGTHPTSPAIALCIAALRARQQSPADTQDEAKV